MAHYHISNGQWGQIYALGTFSSGILMIWAGSAVDWFRVRYLAPILLVTLAMTCLAMAFNSNIWALVLIIFGLRFCGQGMLSHISAVAMAKWFTANRGKAIAIGGLGFSIGEAFLPIITVALLIWFDWHIIWIMAAAVSIFTVPLIFWLLQKERNPTSSADTTEHKGMNNKDWTRADALRHPLFWLLLPLSISPSALITALFFQQVHIAQVKGWSHAIFVGLFPLYSLTTVLFMLVFGVLVDHIGSRRLIAWIQLPMALGFLLLWQADTIALAGLGMILLGIAQGAWISVPVAFWADIYGSRHLGSIKSALSAIMVFGSAIGPIVSGYFIDLGISFPMQMPAIGIYILLVCGLSFYAVKRH